MGRSWDTAALFVLLLCVPAVALAQATVTGVVRDTSGAVLPGVTVEAASPALIEGSRTAVTDGTGQYRIIDLRAGTYTVTFTLPGFSTFERDGVLLSGNFTATVNAELRVGALEETVTVSGEAPTVDVQSTVTQQVISREVIAALPTGRAFQHVAILIPAMASQGGIAQDVGGTRGAETASDRYIVHGGLVTDSRVLVQGLGVGTADGGGASGTYYLPPVGTSSEVVVNVSGGLGEADTGGVAVNTIPSEGGNTLRGALFFTGANSSMQSDNYSEELQQQGLREPNRVAKVWDLNPSIGGPVFQNKLWFFLAVRRMVANNYVAGMYYNKNAGNPNVWTYEPDFSRQVIRVTNFTNANLTLTLQASARNKFSLFWDEQDRCVACPGATPTGTPEATGRTDGGPPNRAVQLAWSSPLTNRILLDAAYGGYILRYHWENEPPMAPHLIPVTEQSTGVSFRGLASRGPVSNASHNSRASFSYITGAHSVKVGYRGSMYDRTPYAFTLNGGLAFRVNNGVPNQLTQRMSPVISTAHLWAHGVYAQDQWTIKRLTLQGAVRYDHWAAVFPDQQLGPNDYLSERFFFAKHKPVSLHDLTPRMGAAYDLFGNGKTALKTSLAKYVLGQESSSAGTFGSNVGPIVRLTTSTSRSWQDLDRDFVPDCNLRSPGANGECGPMANQSFGTDTFGITYDPEVLKGWGIRPYQWAFETSVQHELLPRVSVGLGFFRRSYGNLTVTDNLATTAADYTLFRLTAPVDSRLPTSGSVLTVADVNPNKFGQDLSRITAASNFGKLEQNFVGVDGNVNMRFAGGLQMQGGFSTGRDTLDDCEIVEQLPEALGSRPLEYCHVESPFRTRFKGLGTYTIPRWDVQVSGTVQSIPGDPILANRNVPNAEVAPRLGRNLSGGAANKTVSLVADQSLYSDRLNQFDFRVAKILRFAGTRMLLGLDLFNVFNSNTVQAVNGTYGPSWLAPTLVHSARLAKVTVQVDF